MHAVDVGIYSVIGVLVLAAVMGPSLPDAAESLPDAATTLPHGPQSAGEAQELGVLAPELPAAPELTRHRWDLEGDRRDDDRRDRDRGDDDDDDDEDDDDDGDGDDDGGKRGRRGKG